MCIIIFLAVRWHWGMWRFVKLRPGEHGRVMYICIFHKNASQISHIIFPNNNPSVSHIWHCSNTPLFRKQGHFLFRDALVRVTSSLSPVVLLYISFLAISAFLTYLKYSNLSRGTTSRTGSFLLPLKTAPTPAIFANEAMRRMQVTRLLVGNVFSIVILF